DQTIAIELPLKFLIFEDEDGSIFIEFKFLESLMEDYYITDYKKIKNMNNLLKRITRKAASIYNTID
ncbi:hypothetical protein, partial [Cetobacterium sp.]